MNIPIEWTEAWLLNFEPMDSAHRVFVALLARAQCADDTDLTHCWQALIEHTQQHFAREDQWMHQSSFINASNHCLQHRMVLNLMREGLTMVQAGDTGALRTLADELASWFGKHIQTLDAALALHMRRNPSLTGEA